MSGTERTFHAIRKAHCDLGCFHQHPVEANGEFPRHRDLGDLPSPPHRQVKVLTAPFRDVSTSWRECQKPFVTRSLKSLILTMSRAPKLRVKTTQFPNTGISRIGGVNTRLPSTTRLKTHSRSRFCLNELRLVGREKQIARQCLVDLCLSPPCLH